MSQPGCPAQGPDSKGHREAEVRFEGILGGMWEEELLRPSQVGILLSTDDATVGRNGECTTVLSVDRASKHACRTAYECRVPSSLLTYTDTAILRGRWDHDRMMGRVISGNL